MKNESQIATIGSLELQDTVTQTSNHSFIVNFGPKTYNIRQDEIAYIFSRNKISYFYTKEGRRIASDFRMQDLESDLDPNQFFRANRQLIVSKEAIADMRRHVASRIKLTLTPSLDERIIISTEKTRQFKKWIKRLDVIY